MPFSGSGNDGLLDRVASCLDVLYRKDVVMSAVL